MKPLLAVCVLCVASLCGADAGIISSILDHTSLDYTDIFPPKIHSSPIFLSSVYSTKLHALPPTTITIHNKYAVPVARPYAVPIIKTTHVAAPYPVRIHVDKPYPLRVAKHFPVFVDKPVAVPVDRPYPVPVLQKLPVFKDFEVPKLEDIKESSFFKPINVPDFSNFGFSPEFNFPQFDLPSGLTEQSSSEEEAPAAAEAPAAPAEMKEEGKGAATTSAEESSSSSS